jgi:hypothetical protein
MSPQPADLHARMRAESPSDLREALMAQPPRRPAAAAPPRQAAGAAAERGLVPTARELLASSANVQRLCESYHNTRSRMVARGRRQRLGIAAMVCVLAVASVALFREGSLADTTVTLLMVTVGVASAVGLGVLAALWLREDRNLRQAQGDRLLRALQFNCSLPGENLAAFRALVPPQQAFFDCYAAWRLEHPERQGGLAALLHSGRRPGRASA